MKATERARAHELFQGTLIAAYLFLIVTCTVIGKAVRDALFLSRFTTLQMAYADLQTVVAIGLAMGVYFRLLRCLTFRGLLLSSSVFFTIADVACWRAASSHQAWLTRAIYYLVGIQAAITLPSVSMLARQVLTTREAKRVSGLIGAGAILGWIIGGLVTRDAAGRFGTEALLLLMAALTAAGPMVVLTIEGPGEAGGLDVHPADRPARHQQGLIQSAALVCSCPHLRTVACLVFLSSAVTTIAGFQFKAIASQSIGPTDRFAAFLGTFSFQAGLVSLAVQLLLTSRVLQYGGVGIALVIAPLALATGSVGVLIWGSLSAAVFLKGSDHVLRHSIDRAALDLLYAPLSPDETLQAKTFIEAVVYRVGDGVGALAVAFGATVLHLSFPSLSIISLGFLGGWLAVALRAPDGYRQRLLVTLREDSHTSRPARADDPGGIAASRAALAEHSADRMLVDRLFEPDQARRLEVLRALNASAVCPPRAPDETGPLVTALAAEIVGLYRLSEAPAQTRLAGAEAQEYAQSIERICCLLKLLSPEHDPLSALRALQSGDARLEANALEYLENILKPQYRGLLVPLLEIRP